MSSRQPPTHTNTQVLYSQILAYLINALLQTHRCVQYTFEWQHTQFGVCVCVTIRHCIHTRDLSPGPENKCYGVSGQLIQWGVQLPAAKTGDDGSLYFREMCSSSHRFWKIHSAWHAAAGAIHSSGAVFQIWGFSGGSRGGDEDLNLKISQWIKGNLEG